MLIRCRKADLRDEPDVDDLIELHTQTFGDDAPLPEFDYGHWWLLYEADAPDEPVAFCGVVASSYGAGVGYLKRAGVMPAYRGYGLQRRMIRLREAQARKEGWHMLISDTTEATHSANNLIRLGYQTFTPKWGGWGWPQTIYWKKDLPVKTP